MSELSGVTAFTLVIQTCERRPRNDEMISCFTGVDTAEASSSLIDSILASILTSKWASGNGHTFFFLCKRCMWLGLLSMRED